MTIAMISLQFVLMGSSFESPLFANDLDWIVCNRNAAVEMAFEASEGELLTSCDEFVSDRSIAIKIGSPHRCEIGKLRRYYLKSQIG